MIMKPFLLVLGVVSLGLGALGVFLPLLPTVPFVLLAAFCFARSSDRFHRRLMASKVFGPMIHHWQATRSMSRRSKYVAITSIVASGALSLYLVPVLVVQIALVVVLSALVVVILALPVSESLLPEKK